MRTFLCALLLIALTAPLSTGQTKKRRASAPASPVSSSEQPTAIIHTTEGDLRCNLFEKETPVTVANFIGLSMGTKAWKNPVNDVSMQGTPLYDNTIFHRVVPSFMIQGGDPAGNGRGGPGYTFADEIIPTLTFDRPGRLAMVNSGPNSNGSQFFITEVALPQLNGRHTIFGQCDEAAMELVKKIARMASNSGDNRPLQPVKITHIEITTTTGFSGAIVGRPVTDSSSEPAGNDRGVIDVDRPVPYSLEQNGPYYALLIGINTYRDIQELRTPVDDVKALAKVLHDRYGFKTKLLLNAQATRYAIKTALSEYRGTLPENANLLVYYAGHGRLEKDADKAYWLPWDAEPNNAANWIIADEITTEARVIPAKHILIVSDSCYSGGITRDVDVSIAKSDMNLYLLKMQRGKSRTLMSSGGVEPVADSGGGGHSVFARALLQGLEQMSRDVFSTEDLFLQFIRVPVAGKSDQIPQYNVIRSSGHDDGDFVFSRHKPAN